MYQKILIEDLKIDVFIGAYSAERTKKQKIIINLELILLNHNSKTSTDNLEDITDYAQFRKLILKIVKERNYHLLETLADTILKRIKKNVQVRGIKLKITKPDIFDDCSVSYEVSDYL